MNGRDDPAWRAEKIAWRFSRSGQSGKVTARFEEFSAETQAALTQLAELSPGELPSVATFRSAAEWMVFTSTHLRRSSPDGCVAVPLSELRDGTLNPGDLVASGGKERVDQVTVVTTNGRVVVGVEPGAPMVGVWNVLKMVARWNLTAAGEPT